MLRRGESGLVGRRLTWTAARGVANVACVARQGFNLLTYLESLIGSENFLEFAKSYIEK